MQGKVLALVGLAEFLQMITLFHFQSQRDCWSGKVSANDIYKISQTKEIPVTAESTNAEAEAMKLGPMDGGRELKEIKPYQYWIWHKQTGKPCQDYPNLEAVDGPEAADADLLRLIRWDARGKPGGKKGESIFYF